MGELSAMGAINGYSRLGKSGSSVGGGAGSSAADGEIMVEDSELSWIQWFCSLEGNTFLCQVNECFIRDRFNLTDLQEQVTHYGPALRMILDLDYESENDEMGSSWEDESDRREEIEKSAALLYGLIHARYILVNAQGIKKMAKKWWRGDFGKCPRYHCRSQNVLPIGLSDKPRESYVHLYCPRCRDIYTVPENGAGARKRCGRLDGAYFGTGFPHMLLFTYPQLFPKPATSSYVPRLFGFQLSEKALNAGGGSEGAVLPFSSGDEKD